MSTPTLAPARSSTSGRPTGVTVLGVLAIVAGAVSLLAGLALLAVGSFASAVGFGSDNDAFGLVGAFGVAAGVLVILYGIFAFAVAYGLFTRKRWAWYATGVIVVLQALAGLGSLVSGDFLSGLVGLAIAALVVWYLLRPDVQSWFGVSYKAPWTYRQTPPHA